MIRQVVFGAGLELRDSRRRPPGTFRRHRRQNPVRRPRFRSPVSRRMPLSRWHSSPERLNLPDAVWIPNRGAATIVRVDAKDNNARSADQRRRHAVRVACRRRSTASGCLFAVTGARDCCPRRSEDIQGHRDVEDGRWRPRMAASPRRLGSIWAITDRKGVLSRIDPDSNAPVAEVYVAGGAVVSRLRRGRALDHERGRKPADASQSPQQRNRRADRGRTKARTARGRRRRCVDAQSR